MSDQQTWAEALNISPESLSQWSSQAPAGKPLLVYCLEQGLVPLKEYFDWAQQHFGLPILSPSYFQEAFDPSELEAARANGTWYPWCFPVGQWEDVTYVGCVEPQETEDNKTCFVLVDPLILSQAWGETSPSIGKPANLDMPAGMVQEIKPFTLNIDEATFNIGPETQVAQWSDEQSVEESYIETAVDIPPAVVQPMKKTEPLLKSAAVPVPQLEAEDEESAITNLFTALKERYSSALIMKCNEQTASIYRCDDSLNPGDDSEKTTVNLSYPTFIRIVKKTNLPYHGYLVDSPAHRDFFAGLGLSDLPVCLTAIPLRVDDKLWGVMVAFGQEEVQKMDSLSFAQDHCHRLLQAVSDSWSKAA